MGDAIRFWHRGALREVRDVPATTTVLAWLRDQRISMGTKEGCNEGDCGACAVVLARRSGDGTIELGTAHACMLLMPMLHGSALFTIEDIGNPSALHPVQQSMVDHAASQCGYCTPGIVMSLWCARDCALDDGRALTADDVRTALAGHVCRCTGYRPIVDAGVEAGAVDGDRLDRRMIATALEEIADDDILEYAADGTLFVAPTTTDGLLAAMARHPEATIVAGGTDLVPAVPGRGPLPGMWVWTGRVAGLRDVAEVGGTVRIGGAATIEQAWRALAARWPGLSTGWQRFASPAVRGTGTLAGNLVTGSPVGDSAPVLLALDARLVIVGAQGERLMPMSAFGTGYRRTALTACEIVAWIEVPIPDVAWDVRAYKVARRFDNDIATLSAAFALQLDGARVAAVRVAFGGMSAVTSRATAVERALVDRDFDHAAIEDAQRALASDFAPLSDHRGSAEYRMQAACGLLERWWLQARPADPLDASRTEVWSAP